MFGFNMFENVGRPFKTQYRCYSVSMLPGNERQDVEKGGKIIMPPSALDQLSRLNIVYPMLFKLTNKKTDRMTHSGVLEFVADEGKIYLPYWLMRNLLLEEGGLVQVESASLPVATYSKFQPQASDFLDITNPKAVLENALRSFACLTTGDIVAIKYNKKDYELLVMETKPGKAVSIIECDMSVEFDAPVGYKEPERQLPHQPLESEDMSIDSADLAVDRFVAFQGSGHRLDGKKKRTETKSSNILQSTYTRGIPNYEYKKGKITFIRAPKPVDKTQEGENSEPQFEAFSGAGQPLRRKGHKGLQK
ncbi:ubiquitin recognition factor in ER-associated degradation protein 1-like [Saccoglossus kowalevskii]|uniref:Ubiquitin fusion degradation protein 1 homolog n=1 Tax=Saccoglossus kowalevskii TaxID=10224 RepID=A0ABM0MDH0_SACKO|nr:PREDICTED: ubiquitin fusion degradation protein 1 homolog [Saccoglossus kowalevskii]